MAFQKGQQKPLNSGRKKGTPNKSTAFGLDTIQALLTDYKEQGLMNSDFMVVEPRDRLMLMKDLVGYLIPKKSAVKAEMEMAANTNNVIEILKKLAEENEM